MIEVILVFLYIIWFIYVLKALRNIKNKTVDWLVIVKMFMANVLILLATITMILL